MLNILDISEPGFGVMLGVNVPTYIEAMNWLEHYRTQYPKGFGYPDRSFVLVRQCECCGIYHIIQ